MNSFRAIGRLSAAAVAVALIATSAIPAYAASNDPTTAPAKERKASKGTQYCIQEAMSGSRLPRKVCKSRADWISEDGFDPLSQR